MGRPSSDVDDQRATEIARVADLGADRFREFSTSDFEVSGSEERTDPGQLLPAAPVYRIVIGRPEVEDEFGALEEVVEILSRESKVESRDLEKQRSARGKRRLRWIATIVLALAFAAVPYDLLESIVGLIRSL